MEDIIIKETWGKGSHELSVPLFSNYFESKMIWKNK